MDLELFFAALFKCLERRDNVKIEYKIERRTKDGVYVCKEFK